MSNDGRVLFVSDVHLTPEAPDVFVAFCRFLDEVAPGARSLYVLGDLFDFWVGAAQLSIPGYEVVFARMRRLREAGTEVLFLPGNRDFALDGPWIAEYGLTFLPDVAEVELGERRAVLTHGDLLCTRDVRYLRMRRVLRSRFVRRLMGLMPGSLVLRLAEKLRVASRVELDSKPAHILRPDFEEARSWLEERGCDTLIFGHVHWGERYSLRTSSGGEADVIVLGDWERGPNYAEWDGNDLTLRRYVAAG